MIVLDVAHANFLGHPTRSHIFWMDNGDELDDIEFVECEFFARRRRFGRVPPAPRVRSDVKSDLQLAATIDVLGAG